MTDQNLELRIQQIILSNAGQRTNVVQAAEQALREKYTGPKQFDELIQACVKFFVRSHSRFVRELKGYALELPEPKQGSLFDIPNVIFVESSAGTMFVTRDVATIGEVREWDRRALQYHSVQHLRFQRLTKELELVADIDDKVPWKDAFAIIQNRHRELHERAAS